MVRRSFYWANNGGAAANHGSLKTNKKAHASSGAASAQPATLRSRAMGALGWFLWGSSAHKRRSAGKWDELKVMMHVMCIGGLCPGVAASVPPCPELSCPSAH